MRAFPRPGTPKQATSLTHARTEIDDSRHEGEGLVRQRQRGTVENTEAPGGVLVVLVVLVDCLIYRRLPHYRQ